MMPSRSVARDRQASVVAAPPVKQQVDPIIGELDDDLFEHAPHDTLARLRGRVRNGSRPSPDRLPTPAAAHAPPRTAPRGGRPSGLRGSLPVAERRRAARSIGIRARRPPAGPPGRRRRTGQHARSASYRAWVSARRVSACSCSRIATASRAASMPSGCNNRNTSVATAAPTRTPPNAMHARVPWFRCAPRQTVANAHPLVAVVAANRRHRPCSIHRPRDPAVGAVDTVSPLPSAA